MYARLDVAQAPCGVDTFQCSTCLYSVDKSRYSQNPMVCTPLGTAQASVV
jgi:hypothetical protein